MPPRPYGNDFIVGTPSLDRLEERLYAEQKQKEAQQQYNIKQLDDEFSKNVSNIRDADVDDFTNLYNDYKLATQSSIKNKSGTSPQQQMELLRKRANMYKLINESKAEREREEMYGKRYSTKPDDFNDNAPELLIEGRKLPISKKRNYIGADGVAIDLTNPQNLLWQDKTNWQPILQKAGGTLNRRGESTRVKLPGGLEEEETTYKGLSSPVDYYQSIVGAAMSSPRGAKSLSNRYQFTPEEAQDITIKFEALKNTPEFKAAYGDVKFPEFADMTEGTRTAKLLAMTHALNNPIVAEKKNIKNTKGIIDYNFANKKIMAAIQQKYKQSNIILAAGVRSPATGEVVTPPKDGENYDLTERLQGLKVSTLVNTPYGVAHDSKILYNPKTNEISYTDFNGNKKTKPFNQFKKDISTINTVQDLKIVDEVMNSIKSPQSVNKNKPQAGKYD